MEGLLLAEILKALAAQLPSERSPWRFPDERTCELSLADGSALRIVSRPGSPGLSLEPAAAPRRAADGSSPSRKPLTSLQAQLGIRAAGELLSATQHRLDRIAFFEFGGSAGFVPSPPVRLVLEATGPHANLVLLSEDGTILGVEREVRSERPGRSGGRRLAVGVRYAPPAAQPKLDPRDASAAELEAALVGRELADVRRVIDGIGAELQAALTAATGMRPSQVLTAEDARAVATEIESLVARPAAYLARHAPVRAGAAGSERAARSQADRERLAAQVSKLLGRELRTIRARLADAEAALAAEPTAALLRSEGDLLLARAAEVESGASRAELTGFGGEAVSLELDPKLSAADNAQERYHRARRVAARARAAEAALGELRERERELDAQLRSLPTADTSVLRSRLDAAGTAGERGADLGRQARRGRSPARAGIELTDPRGYRVIIGRGAKENDEITFRRARSRDLWLHAQGYRGAHVIVVVNSRAPGEQVPFETVLFAARLAAGHSEARQSDNVPVDYTERKNVWRKPGGAPGAVNYAHHKTVYVTPARDAAGAAG